ncbi:hypothetical protein [Ideonella livida]|uniref:Uncharacterized protein n=1 Tax=Ideonella livida TaxID=2707176 RepID=A0A7C9PJH0_9BURK|nr:hypothetical protein [Ideonella livida]NDY93516.1 hypothetical protein [Ideonella livida]
MLHSHQLIAALQQLGVPECPTRNARPGHRSKARGFQSPTMAYPVYVKVADKPQPVHKQPLVMHTGLATTLRPILQRMDGLHLAEPGHTVASSGYCAFASRADAGRSPRGTPLDVESTAALAQLLRLLGHVDPSPAPATAPAPPAAAPRRAPDPEVVA